MRTNPSSYALEGIEAVTVEVRVDGDRMRVVETESGRCIVSVTLGTTLSTGTLLEHLVNIYTHPGHNLAPADLKKDANGLDLPISLGLLAGSGQVSFDRPGNYAIVGELALTGETRSV
jgi:magnesium chelatase family protein